MAQNCIKIIRNVEKLESMTDCSAHFQLTKFCMNTCTQYMSVNITLPSQEQFLSVQHRYVDTVIVNAILKKGTRGSFNFWGKDDDDLAVTVIQKPHTFGGFRLTPDVVAQTSAKVTMSSMGLVGSLSLSS